MKKFEEMTTGEKQHLFAAQKYIQAVMNSGNNPHKLTNDTQSLKKVLEDDAAFPDWMPYWMHLGTGKKAKSIQF